MQQQAITDGLTHRLWHVRGQVQGVGFRPFVYRLARELELSGTVANDPSGVRIEAWARPALLDDFERRLRSDAPALARIDELRRVQEGPADRVAESFRIVESDHASATRGRVTVDSATCPDCLREMRDANDRRHRHALINCTNCGPRYTIVRDLPYDRPLTTMAGFPMCPRCAAEYEGPGDRRFHAQPTCCPGCGPRLAFETTGVVDGRDDVLDPIGAAATLLRGGGVLAMKGLGGYHLVVDATNEDAVARLRRGKRRDHKPFALMVASPEEAGRLVELSDDGRRLLESPARPIVLAPRSCGRDEPPVSGGPGADRSAPRMSDVDLEAGGRAVAASVAPGCHRLGVMLPYTPMQHLLLDACPGPLVMTSANLSDDPLISDDDDARARLAGIADARLAHDRPIERAVDDSIAIDAPFGVLPLRRARGYVPAPLPLPVAAITPGLCVGGELKGAVAVVRDAEAILGQHLGDLTYALAYKRFERTIADLLRLFDVAPRWVACDAHPMYGSHRFARRLAVERGLELLLVQHHHAHLASLLAEHGQVGPIVGVICDGVGYGGDGQAWGGEVLVGGIAGFARAGRLRPLRLPGGDAAARRTGRCAASWILDAMPSADADDALSRRVLPEDDERRVVHAMLAQDVNCPPSSGTGRLFDAAAAVLGLCGFNHHEAMSGMALEAAAAGATARPDGHELLPIDPGRGADGPFEIDHRPLLRRLLETARRDGVEAAAWLFHDALADGLARAAVRAAASSALDVVGLSGGVFCNTLLTELVRRRLDRRGLEVLVHRRVPPNDGGLAYGQAAVAAATGMT